MARVIVIGAGVVGTSAAFRLTQSGADVSVIDRSEPGSGTTGNSFAWVNANQKTPRAYFDLNSAGMQEHDRLEAELGSAPWLHRGGNLTWTGDPVRYDELCQQVERLQSWGYRAEWLSAEEVNEGLEPRLTFSGPTLRVAWFPDESWLDGPLYARSLLDRALHGGAEFRTATVGEIDISPPGPRVTLGDGEVIEGDAIINAAGPAADEIAGMVGRRLPLTPTRGLLARVSLDRPLLGRIVHGPDVNLRPDGDGHLLLHHDSIDPLIGERATVSVDDSNCRELCKRAKRLLPDISASRVTETRVGVRPYPRDGVSCIGAVDEIPGYFEAVTHSGVTLGPLIGRLIADEIMLGTVDAMLSPFRPNRFSSRCQ